MDANESWRFKSSTFSPGWLAASLLLLAVCFSGYRNVSQQYPYYFMWDMDAVAATDALLINSGEQPDHLFHPCFGMYLTLAKSAQVAQASGNISASNLSEYSSALNPALVHAEYVQFLRSISPWFQVLTVLACWLALRARYALGGPAGFLLLALIGTQPFLFYQAGQTRSDSFAICFALMGFAIASLGMQRNWRTLALVVFGAGLGLAMLTKLQTLFVAGLLVGLVLWWDLLDAPGGDAWTFHPSINSMKGWARLALGLILAALVAQFIVPLGTALAAIAVLTLAGLAWLGVKVETRPESALFPTPKWSLALLSLSALNLVVYLVLFLLAWNLKPEAKHFDTYFRDVHIGRNGIAPALGLFALFGLQFLLWKRGQTGTRLFERLNLLTFIVSGAFLSLLLHFMAFSSLEKSSYYLLLDFRILFLRPSYYEVTSWELKLNTLLITLQTYSAYVVVSLAALGLLIRAGRSGWIRCPGSCAGIALMVWCLAGITFGTRGYMRDEIFVEILLGLPAAAILLAVLPRMPLGSGYVKALVLFPVIVLLLDTNLPRAMQTTDHLNALFPNVGWQESEFLKSYGSGTTFTQVFTKRPESGTPTWTAQLDQAAQVESVRERVNFAVQHPRINLTQTGLALPGLRVWKTDEKTRIAEVSERLRGATLLDLTFSGQSGNKLKPIVNKNLGDTTPLPLLPISSTEASALIALLPRSDLDVIVMLKPDAAAALLKKDAEHLFETTNEKITLQGEDKIELVGVRVLKYAELDRSEVGPVVLILKKK